MIKLTPFADDAASVSIGSLTVKNGTDRVAIYGSLDITRDKPGLAHALTLPAGGRVLAWGRDNQGQLGDGTTTDSATPVRVHLPPGFTPTAIGSGWGSRTVLAIGHRTRG